MFLNQELLSSCEELFDQIANEEQNEDLDDAIEGLRSLLEKDVDGFTQLPEDELAYQAQLLIREIWTLVSSEEKEINSDILELCRSIFAITQDACGYEDEGFEDEE